MNTFPDSFRTPEDAVAQWLCPAARTFGSKQAVPHCRGSECAAWRWKPINVGDEAYSGAVKREIATLAEQKREALRAAGKSDSKVNTELLHKQAVARVAADPEGCGIVRERGYCGLGGLPK